jgi:hypothetical protein
MMMMVVDWVEGSIEITNYVVRRRRRRRGGGDDCVRSGCNLSNLPRKVVVMKDFPGPPLDREDHLSDGSDIFVKVVLLLFVSVVRGPLARSKYS